MYYLSLMEIKLKNMELKKLGGSYMFIVPKALVNTEIIETKKKYCIKLCLDELDALDGFLSHVACEV
jgi:hypothetical protein